MRRVLKYFTIFVFIGLSACSTQKNTPVTRAYHNLTAHYNVYFNGMVSFQEGKQKVDNYKENYSRLLPVFKYDIDEATKTASSDMDRTLTKMGKTIKVHSITVKPKMKGKLTPQQKAFMQKKEYCKWIDDAYLLIGKADFYKKDYDKALRAFHKIENDYKEENTRFDAQLWIARVYLQQQKFKDAYDILSKLENDTRFPKRLNKDLQLTYADYYIKKKDYSNAVFRLQKAIDLTKKRKEKARYYFILAQIEHLLGEDSKADLYYKKVIKITPDYDLSFNAKINRAVLATQNSNPDQLRRQLLKLLKDEKNEDYQDQIYYALAQIELNNKDTAQAVEYLKLSAQKSTSNNTQKSLSFLSIADIYFAQRNYLQAGKYYDSTMQYLDKKYPDYEQVSARAKNTGLLVQYLGEVMRQDSLQRVAMMPEDKRNALIDSIIREVRLQEERKRQEEQDNMNYFDPTDFSNQQGPTSQGGKWYMYNPVLVSRGKAEFKKKWGNRKLEDNWRRKNKSISNNSQEVADSSQTKDSTRITDNKTREFYLQDLPLNDSLMAISNKKVEVSLFKAADVYETLLKEPKSAIDLYKKLLNRFPNSEFKLEAYYRLYKIYTSIGDQANANFYKSKIINEFPSSKYAQLLLDPTFADKLKAEQNAAMNIYYKALNSYNKDDYSETFKLLNKGILNYPQSDAYPYYLFLKGKTYAHLGQKDSMVAYFNLLIKDYPKSDITPVASDILKMMKETRYNYDLYKLNPKEEYYFAIVLPDDEYTNELNFKLKHQSELFSQTEVYTIKKEEFDKNLKIVTVHKFKNLQEALKYNDFINKSGIFQGVENATIFIISKSNYQMLMKDRILEKYLEFYRKQILSQ